MLPSYRSWVVTKIEKYESSNFVLLFQDCFSFLELLEFHMIYGISFSMSAKTAVRMFTGGIASIGELGECYHLNNSQKSSTP
jgi:hypothetical protein